jgi:hypothetical protein
MRYIQSGSGIESFLPKESLCLYFCAFPPLRNFCYHLFLPLLSQVAIAGLSPGDIAAPLREVFSKHKHLRTLLGEVRTIDVDPAHP